MLRDGKSPGADGLYQEVIKRRGRMLVKVLYINIKKRLWILGSPYRLEERPPSHYLQKGRQKRLMQLRQELVSLHTRESFCTRTLQQTIDLRGGQTWSFLSDKYRRNALNSVCSSTLVEFTKAFDTCDREALPKLECPEHFVKFVSTLHTEMRA